MHKDWKKLVKPYLKRGWLLSDKGKHNKITAPCGRIIFFAKTPSCPRAVKNFAARLRRVDRGEDV